MKIAVAIVVALTATGCSANNPLSPSPAPTTATAALVAGYVVDGTGGCIRDAKVEAIAGQAVGEVALQETPCSAWDYSGGFSFKNLKPGIAIAMRASAPGYVPRELTVLPFTGSYVALELTLDPIR